MGADVNAADKVSTTRAQFASSAAQRVFRLQEGRTPLSVAAQYGDYGVMMILLRAGALVDASDLVCILVQLRVSSI